MNSPRKTKPPMPRKKPLKRIAVWIALGAVSFLMFIALLFGLIQTQTGKRLLASRVSSMLSAGPQTRIELAGLSGLVPFDFQIDSLVVQDENGPLIEADGLAVDWLPLQLLKGKIHVREIRIDRLRLERFPASEKKAEKGSFELPDITTALPKFLIERLEANKIEIGQSVLGEQAAFSMEGTMDAFDPAKGLQASFHIRRTDGPPGRISLAWTIRDAPSFISIDAVVEEPENGLIPKLLGWKADGPLSLQFKGQGPRTAWEGNLWADAGGLGTLDAAIGLRMEKDLHVKADGKFHPAYRILPEPLRPLLPGEQGAFTVDADFLQGKKIIVHGANLRTGAVVTELTGEADLEKRRLDMNVTLAVDNISVLRELTGSDLKGRLSASGNVSGPMNRPGADLRIELGDLEVPALRTSRLESEVRLKFPDPVQPGEAILTVDGKGRIEDLVVGNEKPFAEALVPFDLSVELLPEKTAHVRTLKLSGKDFKVDLAGRLDLNAASVKGKADIGIENLGRFSSLMGSDISGKLNFDADFEGDFRSRRFSAEARALLSGLAHLPPPADALLNSDVRLSTRFDHVPDGQLLFSDLQVQSDRGKAVGNFRFVPSTKFVKGAFSVSIPELDVFSGTIGEPLGGSLELNIDVEGAPSDARVTLTSESRNVKVRGFEFDGIMTEAARRTDRCSSLKETSGSTFPAATDILKQTAVFNSKNAYCSFRT